MPNRPVSEHDPSPPRLPAVGRGAVGVVALLIVILAAVAMVRMISDYRSFSGASACRTVAVQDTCRSSGGAIVIGHKKVGNLGPASYSVRIRNLNRANDAAWVQVAGKSEYDALRAGTRITWTTWSGRFVAVRTAQAAYTVADNPGYRLRRELPLLIALLVLVVGAAALVAEYGERGVIGAPVTAAGAVGLLAGYFVPGPHPLLVAGPGVGAGIVAGVLAAVVPRPALRRRPAPGPDPEPDVTNPTELLEQIGAAEGRLLAGLEAVTDRRLREPSQLPGWSRGHVVTHTARNADGLVNLLTWARTGVETPMYASAASRTADIDAGARRPAAAQVADLEATGARLAAAARDLPAAAWDRPVRWLSGTTRPARAVLGARLREVEIHHVDLRIGYTPADWPAYWSSQTAREIVDDLPPGTMRGRLRATDAGFARTLGDGPTVSGPVRDLLAWLIGRGDGSALSVNPDGPLPAPPQRWETVPPGER